MTLRIKLKPNIEIDEAAKWRATSYNTELTQDELDKIISKYGVDTLGAHYDDGVPTGKSAKDDFDKNVFTPAVPARGREDTQPQKTFNPGAKWGTPVGIYYYPLSWAADKIMNDGVPFAGHSKYIYIYRIKDPSKRLNLSEMLHNGFAERAFLWASKNKEFDKILEDSGIIGKAYGEIADIFGEIKTDPFDDPTRVYVTFMIQQPVKFVNGILGDVWLGKAKWFNDPKSGSRGRNDLLRDVINSATQRSSMLFSHILSPTTGITYAANPATWREAFRKMFKESGLEEEFDKLYNISIDDLPNQEKSIADAMTRKIEEYASKKFVELRQAKSLKPKLTEPPPPETIYNILNDLGYSDAKITQLCYYVINNMMDRKPSKVTKYFIDNGYDVIEDTEGTKSIHVQEAFQGIYLNVGAAEIVGVYLNRFRSGRGKGTETDPKQISIGKLYSLLDSPNANKYIDQAYKLIQKDPSKAQQLADKIFNNLEIKRTKEMALMLADAFSKYKILLSYVGLFMRNFRQILSLQEMEDAVSKILSGPNKNLLQEYLENNPGQAYTIFYDPIFRLQTTYKKKFGDQEPTLKKINEYVYRAKAYNVFNDLGENPSLYKATKVMDVLYDMGVYGNKTMKEYVLLVINNWIPNSTSEAIKFIEMLFEKYPEYLNDFEVIKKVYLTMSFYYADTEMVKSSDIFKKIEGIHSKMVADIKAQKEKELGTDTSAIDKKFSTYGKEKDVVAENRKIVYAPSRFKKLNRIGRYSNFK